MGTRQNHHSPVAASSSIPLEPSPSPPSPEDVALSGTLGAGVVPSSGFPSCPEVVVTRGTTGAGVDVALSGTLGAGVVPSAGFPSCPEVVVTRGTTGAGVDVALLGTLGAAVVPSSGFPSCPEVVVIRGTTGAGVVASVGAGVVGIELPELEAAFPKLVVPSPLTTRFSYQSTTFFSREAETRSRSPSPSRSTAITWDVSTAWVKDTRNVCRASPYWEEGRTYRSLSLASGPCYRTMPLVTHHYNNPPAAIFRWWKERK